MNAGERSGGRWGALGVMGELSYGDGQNGSEGLKMASRALDVSLARWRLFVVITVRTRVVFEGL